MQKWHVFNSTVQTSIENWIKNDWKDYTNILKKKFENDLPSYFEDYSLEKHDVFDIIRHIGRTNDRVSYVVSQRGQV